MPKITIIILFILLVSCSENQTTETSINTILKHHNIQSQFFDIDIRKDTTIFSLGGATIYFSKESIKSERANNIVTIELKEVYTIADMVKAGLTTKSGNEILSSGGMIYINAVDAQIKEKVSIKISSNNYREEMQLFKGQVNATNNIDWQNPVPLTSNTTLDTLNLGKQIFTNNCSSCHSLTKDATGPPLAFLPQRRNKEWLNQKIRNSAALISSGDALANCLYRKWNKVAMTSFNFSDDELNALYLYLNEISKNLNPNDYPDFKLSLDSCITYFEAKSQLYHKLEELKHANGTEVTVNYNNISITQPINIPNYIQPKYELSTYYQFEISSFGWYNVDAFINDFNDFETSKLKVKVNNRLEDVYNIYLIIPKVKMFTNGGLLKESKDWYGFYTTDGKIKLPQNEKAHIMVFCEKDEKISFKIFDFNTQLTNIIEIDAEEISKEEMQKQLDSLNFEGLDLSIQKSKNEDEIKKITIDLKNIEKFKPHNTDCDCFTSEINWDSPVW